MSDSFPDITNIPWQPVDYLPFLKETLELWGGVEDDLRRKAKTKAGQNWAHHLPQLVDTIQSRCALLREEIENYGQWRSDGLQIEEVIQSIDEDMIEILNWVCRIIGMTPP